MKTTVEPRTTNYAGDKVGEGGRNRELAIENKWDENEQGEKFEFQVNANERRTCWRSLAAHSLPHVGTEG